MPAADMSDGQIEEVARLFGLLAEPARLRLLRALLEGPAHVGALAEAAGLRQGVASKHLGLMLAGRFVRRRREGAHVVYEVADPVLKDLCSLMCERMRREVVERAAAVGL